MALAITIAALCYAVIALTCVIAFGVRRARFDAQLSGGAESGEPAAASPPMTILKPIAGLEPGLFENLSSFCAQNYPQFQVVFGVDRGDAATAALIEDVARAHPDVPVARAAAGAAGAANLKVARLLTMLPLATYDILVISDADTHVDRDYLRALARAFPDESVGAATCLYRGAGRGGMAAALGAMMIDEQFMPSVLVAALGGVHFTLGATMAVRRRALEAIGGFEALAPYLADDQKLGEFVGAKGFRIALAPHVVEHRADEPNMRALWEHELRWARTNRSARPLGYSGYFLTFAWPWALLYVALAGTTPIALALLGAALALRVALHYRARSALAARSPDMLWLFPVRDLLGLAVWAASWFGTSVRWRGRALRIDSQGRIVAGE